MSKFLSQSRYTLAGKCMVLAQLLLTKPLFLSSERANLVKSLSCWHTWTWVTRKQLAASSGIARSPKHVSEFEKPSKQHECYAAKAPGAPSLYISARMAWAHFAVGIQGELKATVMNTQARLLPRASLNSSSRLISQKYSSTGWCCSAFKALANKPVVRFIKNRKFISDI